MDKFKKNYNETQYSQLLVWISHINNVLFFEKDQVREKLIPLKRGSYRHICKRGYISSSLKKG